MEIWKPVLGFEESYEVSNFGNVRRTARGKTIESWKIPHAKGMFKNGATLKVVADYLGVSIPTAHSIKLEKTWVGDSKHRQVKPRMNRTHYLIVDFCKNGKYTKRGVHRIVWEAFNNVIPEGMEINHKDLNRSNNKLENLEIVTHQQNIQHAIDAYKAKGLLRAVKGVKGFVTGKHSSYNN
jgi:hypothetical protein